MISFATKDMLPEAFYQVMLGAISPRPIAWVSTINTQNVGNLAPFSFFSGVASNPPSLMFSVTYKRDGSKKDTLLNIEENGEFVVNTVHQGVLSQAHQSSAEYAYGIDEMQQVGVTPVPSEHVRPYRVLESIVQMECKVLHLLPVGVLNTRGAAVIVVGEICCVHVHEQFWKDQKIDAASVEMIARADGMNYVRYTERLAYKPAKVFMK